MTTTWLELLRALLMLGLLNSNLFFFFFLMAGPREGA